MFRVAQPSPIKSRVQTPKNVFLANFREMVLDVDKVAIACDYEVGMITKVTLVVSERIDKDVLFYQSVTGFNSTDSYLANMEKAGTWGDGIILEAASLYFNRPIKVLSPDHQFAATATNMSIDNKTSISEQPLFLGYIEYGDTQLGRGQGNHYVSLVPVTFNKQRSNLQGMNLILVSNLRSFNLIFIKNK
jgi:hypothetical protein